jgi:hypothetical protein
VLGLEPYDLACRLADSGAHERNRTADLLLTMQMLYRLSYVGGDAARGTTGTRPRPARVPSGDPTRRQRLDKAKNPDRPSSPLEEGRRRCELQRVRAPEPTVNWKFGLSFRLFGSEPHVAPERGSRVHVPVAPPTACVGPVSVFHREWETSQVADTGPIRLCGLRWKTGAGGTLERETGFEPATLSLEG